MFRGQQEHLHSVRLLLERSLPDQRFFVDLFAYRFTEILEISLKSIEKCREGGLPFELYLPRVKTDQRDGRPIISEPIAGASHPRRRRLSNL